MTKVLVRLIVSGTEGDDSHIRHYRNGVFGGGLNIAFKTVETLAVAGQEGEDAFTVLSSGPAVSALDQILFLYNSANC